MILMHSPWLLLLLLALPPIAWWTLRRANRPAVVYSSLDLFRDVPVTLRQRLRRLPALLMLLAAGLLIIAIARPQTGVGSVRTTARGVAMMVVVDRSQSMEEGFRYQGRVVRRIDAVRAVFKDFIVGNGKDLKGRPEDMIGLVTFTRYAETVCPLVRIHGTLVELVERLDLGVAEWEGGTAIGEGLALAAARLKQAEDDFNARSADRAAPEFTIKSKIIILMTDGVENVGDITSTEAAELCKTLGIKIYPIGIGDRRGGFVNAAGQRVTITSAAGFDEERLKVIARTTGGQYFNASDGDALRRAYAAIDELEKTDITSVEFTSYRERYMPFAVAGLLALALSITLSTTWLHRSP